MRARGTGTPKIKVMFRDEHVTLLKQVALNLATNIHLDKCGSKRNKLERQKKAQPIGTSSDQLRVLPKGLFFEVRACWDEERGRFDGHERGATDHIGVCCRTQRANDAWVEDLVHDNKVACAGMTLEHSRLREVEPKISKVCSLRLATLSCPHQLHTFRPLSCRSSCFVLSCAASGGTPSGVDATLRALDFMWRTGFEGKRQLQTASVDQHSLQGGSGDVFMDSFF